LYHWAQQVLNQGMEQPGRGAITGDEFLEDVSNDDE
jgi:hypothetical protein